jgi:hypothetical protein
MPADTREDLKRRAQVILDDPADEAAHEEARDILRELEEPTPEAKLIAQRMGVQARGRGVRSTARSLELGHMTREQAGQHLKKLENTAGR